MIATQLKVKAAAVKGRPGKAFHIERMLGKESGVVSARVNATTGSISVRFEPARLSQEQVLAKLRHLGCEAEGGPREDGFDKMANSLMKSSLEAALAAGLH